MLEDKYVRRKRHSKQELLGLRAGTDCPSFRYIGLALAITSTMAIGKPYQSVVDTRSAD